MPRKARDLLTRADRVASAWERNCPGKTFSGFTLEEFRDTFKPYHEVKLALAQLARDQKVLRFRQHSLAIEGRHTLRLVVNGVRSDPDVGEGSAVYGSMGYVPTFRRRKPGRKKQGRAGVRSAKGPDRAKATKAAKAG